jgi:hypothetical protein
LRGKNSQRIVRDIDLEIGRGNQVPFPDAAAVGCGPQALETSRVENLQGSNRNVGKNPFGIDAVPISVQFALPVLLAKTPTSVPTYNVPFDNDDPESTMITLTGASGKFAVKSAQEVPALDVFQTCEVWNPMMVT